jgi:hypothetical protein
MHTHPRHDPNLFPNLMLSTSAPARRMPLWRREFLAAVSLLLTVALRALPFLTAGVVTAYAQTYPAWATGVAYNVNDKVSYQTSNYSCLQAHTSQVGWEPPNTPALWQLLSGTTTVPATPTGLTATVNSSSQITVTWTAVSNATGYDLQVDGATVSSVTSPYVQSGLAASSTHTYAVRAKNSAGSSAFSASVSATTSSATTVPATPTGLTATVNSSSQITVTWTAVSNATGYDLQVDGATVSSVTSPYVQSGLAASSTHTYAVRAKNSAGSSAFSASVSATTSSSTSTSFPPWATGITYKVGDGASYQSINYNCLQAHTSQVGWEPPNAPALWSVASTGTTIPATPGGLAAAVNSTSQITVTWNSVSNATGYDLQVDGATVSSVTSPYVHSGLAAGSKHTYAVRAKNSAGASAFSASVSATTQTTTTVPTTPTGLTATVNSSSQITVTWTAVSNATGYDLQVDGATVSSVTSPYVHSGLAVSSTHSYAVRAKNSAGASAFSASVSATTQAAATVPATPTGLTATVNSSSQITVAWNAVSNATGYDLQVDGATVSSVTSPYVHSGLATSSTHKYAVRAKNSAGASAFSASVSATTSSSSSTLTLGQVANPNGRYYAGYYPSWSDNWFTIYNNDGTKKSDNDIYTASNFAKVPGVYTHVMIAFAQPDFSWSGMSANSWSGTGINFNATPADLKEVIRLLHVLKKRVVLAVGGANYGNWGTLATEAGSSSGPTKGALTRFIQDMGVDGLDVDFEIGGADSATVSQYASAIQAMREAVDAAGSGHILTVAAWSTGADYIPGTESDAGYPGTYSYWGGAAGRERLTFKRTVPNGPLAGRTISSLFNVVNVMAYDAQTYHYDPVTAFDEYRRITPSSGVVSIGLEIPPEGWAGGILVVHNSDAGADGTVVVADQYGRTPRGPYSIERSGKYVIANTSNANAHDGLMLWQVLKTQSVAAGSAQSANATSAASYIASLFGYVPTSP